MSATRRPRPWGFGRVALLSLGVMGLLLSIGLVAGGVGLLWADRTQRGDDGYLSTSAERFTSPTFAISSESLDATGGGTDSFLSEDVLGQIRLDVEPESGPVFVGIGPTTQVNGYLAGMEHDEVETLGLRPFRVGFRRHEGAEPTRPPTELDLWVASAAGPGRQTLRWEVEPGEWTVVLMNADGSAGLDAGVRAGAEAPFLLPVAITLLVFGGLFLAASTAMAYAALRDPALEVGQPAAAAPALASVYPVRVRGDLDPGVSRWLWLVKWLLAVPHYLALFFLWLVAVVLTVGAFFAILVRGRYPRGIFEFNLGVMRWTWRVLFYSYWALGTDRYPPFTLGRADDYPAALEIEYPERLSRGLVLVKWILALPHLIIVTLFVGGWGWGVGEEIGPLAGWGLIGILVLVGGAILLARGRFPSGVFDFVLGLDRWVWRVAAYVALMTDRYPPFRLDPGPREPERAAEDDDRAAA